MYRCNVQIQLRCNISNNTKLLNEASTANLSLISVRTRSTQSLALSEVRFVMIGIAFSIRSFVRVSVSVSISASSAYDHTEKQIRIVALRRRSTQGSKDTQNSASSTFSGSTTLEMLLSRTLLRGCSPRRLGIFHRNSRTILYPCKIIKLKSLDHHYYFRL